MKLPRAERRRLLDPLLVVVVAGVDLLVWGGDRATRWGGAVPVPVIPALSVLFAVVLLARWRHPVGVFAVVWLYSLSGLIFPLYQPFAALLAALYAVARRASARGAVAVAAVCVVPFGIDTYNQWAVSSRSYAALVTIALLWFAVTLIIWLFARLAWNAERAAEERRRLETEATLRAERLSLARELHDIVAHAVSAMLIQAAGAGSILRDEQPLVRKALTQIESSGVQAMSELTRLLGLLRAADDDDSQELDPSTMPGLHALGRLVASVRSAGVEIRSSVEGDPASVDPSVSLAAYRVVQEALTNTMRYAGQGAVADLHLAWRPGRLVVTVRDHGGLDLPGSGLKGSGFGLVGLGERVKLVGGELSSGPVADGYLVRAELPTGPTDLEAEGHAMSGLDRPSDWEVSS